MTQRVGSTMLAQALEDIGLVGRPREWLNAEDGEALLRAHGVSNVHALRDTLWTEGVTANGVLGLKYGFVAYRDASFLRLFRELVDEPDPTPRAIFEAMFPRPVHVFLTRRSKVRLAVSWLRLICSGKHAHRRIGEAPLARSSDDAYTFDGIRHLLLEACMREAARHDPHMLVPVEEGRVICGRRAHRHPHASPEAAIAVVRSVSTRRRRVGRARANRCA
jgi:LPS sulfotransferase NodH